MKNIVKQLIKESSIYTLQPTFEKLIAFLLVPIYTAYLTTADYGNLHYIITIGAFLLLIMKAGLETSFWKFRSDHDSLSKEIALNMLFTQVVIGICIVTILYVFKNHFFEEKLKMLIFLYVVGLVCYAVYQSVLLVLRADHKVVPYVVIAIVYALTLASINIFFVAYMKWNYKGIIYGNILTNVFFTLLVFFYFKYFSSRIDFRLSKQMLKYGLPLVPANISSTILSMSDRLFLKQFSTDSELGMYSFGYQFANLVLVFLVMPFFLGWNPIRWEVYKQENSKEVFSRIYRVILMALPVAMLFIIGIAIIAGIFLVRNKEYLNGFSIIAIIASSHILYALYYFNIMGLLFENKTKFISMIVAAAATLNLILNYVLIPEFGMIGAATATFISYLGMFILSRIYCQKYYPFKVNNRLEFLLVFIITFISITAMVLVTHNILSIKMLSLFIFSSGVVLSILYIMTGLLRYEHITSLRELIFTDKDNS